MVYNGGKFCNITRLVEYIESLYSIGNLSAEEMHCKWKQNLLLEVDGAGSISEITKNIIAGMEAKW